MVQEEQINKEEIKRLRDDIKAKGDKVVMDDYDDWREMIAQRSVHFNIRERGASNELRIILQGEHKEIQGTDLAIYHPEHDQTIMIINSLFTLKEAYAKMLNVTFDYLIAL